MVLSHFTENANWTFDPERSYTNDYEGGRKPGGLWLSDETGLGWKQWCVAEHYSPCSYRHDFEVDVTGVIHLKSFSEILAFTGTYILDRESRYLQRIDWSRVKNSACGLVITPFNYDAHWFEDASWYYGWDCASGCFWDLSVLTPVRTAEQNPVEAA